MNKKLGMTLAMLLLTAVGARSATLSPAASPVLKTGTAADCPFIPSDCCQFRVFHNCPLCTKECP
ncbi:MAG TPA: hypothetical protein VFR03_09560 [Thermoanaerobaculia bacterium]|nr:hypothetical protein [Thermoanaerobaculia bacterium]